MSTPTVRAQHAEWLAALDGDGPWLTVPALTERLPNGLVPTSSEQNKALKTAHTAWTTAHAADEKTAKEAWIQSLITDWLGWGDHAAFTGLDRYAHHHVLNASITITTQPTFALWPIAAADVESTTTPVALGFTYPTGTRLTSRVGDGWPTSPIDRAIHALRAADVPLGIVTDGKWWALIWAPRQSTPGYALWSTDILLDDELLRSAFSTLLSRHRSLGVSEEESLGGIFLKSQDSQEDITENLSKQVRKAVELLVDAFSSANQVADDAYFGRSGNVDIELQSNSGPVTDEDIYQAAVTIVMRLVFTFAAEERQLLPSDDDFYREAYGIGALADRLIERANNEGEDVLRESATVFPSILATTRVIHDGVRHPRLDLPGYGGSVFDPLTYPWLEDAPTAPGSGPISVDDRTMLHILRGLTRWEGRRLSYRTLDVEQIGYAYEGLLDHTAVTAREPVLAIRGSKEPEIALSGLEDLARQGDKALSDWLQKTAGMTASQAKAALASRDAAIDVTARHRLDAACGGDVSIADRVAVCSGLLRVDERTGLPRVFNPGTTYVTASSARGDTGTHYTPKFLAEGLVKVTLDRLVYSPGPQDVEDETQWRIISPESILSLKIVDVAMGSGAFLVAAIRYLADQLLDSLSQVERPPTDTPALRDLWDELQSPTGNGPDWSDDYTEAARLTARRLIASRCIYGADVNPMAVEMAKLSIWLVTASRNRPFGFLDHRLISGDALLGLHDPRQLETLHIDPERGSSTFGSERGSLFDFTSEVRLALARAAELREQIAKQSVTDLRSVEEQERLFRESYELEEDLRVVADAISGAALAAANESASTGYWRVLDSKIGIVGEQLGRLFASDSPADARSLVRANIVEAAQSWLDTDRPTGSFRRTPLNWMLAFPEVFQRDRGGFDAVVSNPPFLGGLKIRGALGSAYREYLSQVVANGGRAKTADLVAFFALRSAAVCKPAGVIGILATDSLAQGDTREMGLDRLYAAGWKIEDGTSAAPWPSRGVTLNFVRVVISREQAPLVYLDDTKVSGVTSALTLVSGVDWQPVPLVANRTLAWAGSNLYGDGFLMSPEEAEKMISSDARNKDVLRPFLGGEDVNRTRWSQARRWTIDFGRMSREMASSYALPWQRVVERVKPDRERLDPKKYKRIVDNWWEYWAPRDDLYAALQEVPAALVFSSVSNTLIPVRVDCGQVFSHGLTVLPYMPGLQALLSSSVHAAWAFRFASSLRTDLRYTYSDILWQMVLPDDLESLEPLCAELRAAQDVARHDLELDLTTMYRLVNDPAVDQQVILELREIHRRVDEAVVRAYGWDDIEIDTACREFRGGVRFIDSAENRDAYVNRLIHLNRERHRAELAAGLADEVGKPVRSRPQRSRKSRGPARQEGLFDEVHPGRGPDTLPVDLDGGGAK